MFTSFMCFSILVISFYIRWRVGLVVYHNVHMLDDILAEERTLLSIPGRR